MHIAKIKLRNFRYFKETEIELSPTVTLIVGENARGKTSLLESIYTALYGTGFRESREEQLVHWEEESALVEWVGDSQNQRSLQQVVIKRTPTKRVQKQFFINKSKQTYRAYRKQKWGGVLFAPEDIRIITGSPSRKRDYFDLVLSRLDPVYKKYIRQYKSALRSRNLLLVTIDNEQELAKQLVFWNEYLIERATYLSTKRQEYVDKLNSHNALNDKRFEIIYKQDAMTPARLSGIFTKECSVRRTLVGPHRDEYMFYLLSPNKKDVGVFGSRSEQRMTLLWLKVNEITILEEAFEQKPILLLDDIFSELDLHNKDVVAGLVEKYQTIITSTEDNLGEVDYSAWQVVRLV
ncbi:DNA replication/repair protein RecF [Candidatus Woesebacteria bacterium]|nr:DNA replication/repair protein RecF [Candidatus Woesebacteria bacterium]